MELKLNHRVPQSADRLAAFETGVENELRERLILMGTPGIVSVDGKDIDNDTAPCAVIVNTSDSNAIDLIAGTVVFPNGEFVTLTNASVQAVSINPAVTDSQVVRLEYGEVSDGDTENNPYYNFATQPKIRKKTPREMLVIETVTAFNAQPQSVKDISVVLGVVVITGGVLSIDNGRDTYSYSRPWFSPEDTTHRSKVGSGVVSDTNPHGLSANDLTVGEFTVWEALAGQPASVLARPTGFGRIPGTLCTETIPAGNFVTDATGAVTGKAGSLYAAVGFWPDRLLFARKVTGGNEVAAWIPRGRNVVAVFDPVDFAVAGDLEVFYTKVVAGSLPGSTLGLTTVEFNDPGPNEVLVSGGNFFSALSEKKAIFTDVGLIPMAFDILVDNAGKVYKAPDCVYCNTKLDTIGAAAVPLTIQPRAPTRLRVAISNYNPGFTEVRFQITGRNEAGSSVSEQIVFTGPLPAPTVLFTEATYQRQFTLNIFASLDQFQVLVRNGDGPNTTVSLFAEYSPVRPEVGDDLLLATVHWSGSDVSANYSNTAQAVIDRRLVTRGGVARGASPASMMMNQPGLVESVIGGAPIGASKWATIVEDFNDPNWIRYPQPDLSTTPDRPIELPNTSLGARFGYLSRKMPFCNTIRLTTALVNEALYVRMLPASHTRFPGSITTFTATLTLFRTAGAPIVLTGSLTNAYPPYEVVFPALGAGSGSDYYAATLSVPRLADVDELFQGFLLHARSALP